MTATPTPSITTSSPAEYWHELLKPALLRLPNIPQNFFKRLRKANLTFGDRVHCPFLRPFFLSAKDEERVRGVAETIAELGERVVTAALAEEQLFRQFH